MSEVFTFSFSIGEQDGPPIWAHLEVPMDLTPKQEERLRSLLGSTVFGDFVERIREWRERSAP